MTEPHQIDLSRATRLWLRGWQAAGLAELPRDWLRGAGPLVDAASTAPVAVPAPVATTVPPIQKPSPLRLPTATPPTAIATPVAPIPSTPPPDMSPPAKRPLPTPPPAAPVPVAGSRAERVAALEVINTRVQKCTRCEELARLRNKTVFGVGNPEARLLFIGEAPGADEDASGEPFVGKAGQLLDKIIAACGLRREDLYICNILKCRPPGNRTPEPDECVNCREYLDAQLAIIDPEFIVCWGAVAATKLLGIETAIGKLRRKFHTHGRAKVLCTYHPSYLLRNPPAKKDVWEDMQLLLAEMGLPVPSGGS
jgi:uracil-DNA glycosylase